MPAVPDGGVARSRRRSREHEVVDAEKLLSVTALNNVTSDSVLPLRLYLELESPVSKSPVARLHSLLPPSLPPFPQD